MANKALLRGIPKVDQLLQNEKILAAARDVTEGALLEAVRSVVDSVREGILAGERDSLPDDGEIAAGVAKYLHLRERPSLRRVINGTGIVLHTNLGRACLGKAAAEAVRAVADGFSTLEYDVSTGERGSRYSHVDSLLTKITGAESALVVNNNASAVLLMLSALTKGKEVVVSRGEQVEIGGSFRVPEIMEQSGSTLKEIGTTNKTHMKDYERAINENTGALLKVHTSNFKVMGFTEGVELAELVRLGHEKGVTVLEDLGSGALINLENYGIHDEPWVKKSVEAGVDVITFSGDKLLGGPQAGIIIGKKKYIDVLKKHPLTRAIRIDKLTLAALEATLRAYLDEKAAMKSVPVLAMLSADPAEIKERATRLRRKLSAIKGVRCQVVESESQVGGGSVPGQNLPSFAVSVEPDDMGLDAFEEKLRIRDLPVIGRIHKGMFLLDARTLFDNDFNDIAAAVKDAVSK